MEIFSLKLSKNLLPLPLNDIKKHVFIIIKILLFVYMKYIYLLLFDKTIYSLIYNQLKKMIIPEEGWISPVHCSVVWWFAWLPGVRYLIGGLMKVLLLIFQEFLFFRSKFNRMLERNLKMGFNNTWNLWIVRYLFDFLIFKTNPFMEYFGFDSEDLDLEVEDIVNLESWRDCSADFLGISCFHRKIIFLPFFIERCGNCIACLTE